MSCHRLYNTKINVTQPFRKDENEKSHSAKGRRTAGVKHCVSTTLNSYFVVEESFPKAERELRTTVK